MKAFHIKSFSKTIFKIFWKRKIDPFAVKFTRLGKTHRRKPSWDESSLRPASPIQLPTLTLLNFLISRSFCVKTGSTFKLLWRSWCIHARNCFSDAAGKEKSTIAKTFWDLLRLIKAFAAHSTSSNLRERPWRAQNRKHIKRSISDPTWVSR